MINLNEWTKEQLFEHIETVENEREQIIYLLNKAIPLCRKTACDGCIYRAYCTQQ